MSVAFKLLVVINTHTHTGLRIACFCANLLEPDQDKWLIQDTPTMRRKAPCVLLNCLVRRSL